jgi:uncharacterized membrane protein (UPF0127 family)
MLVLAAAVLGITFPRGHAILRTPTRAVSVSVEIARTLAQKEQGLMHRASLAPNAGMAFLWDAPVRGSFTMRNTTIPLSIAFWGPRGRIVRILDMAPCRAVRCPTYDPHVAFSGALEVNRGAFRRWGVRTGARVEIQP